MAFIPRTWNGQRRRRRLFSAYLKQVDSNDYRLVGKVFHGTDDGNEMHHEYL